MNSSNSAKFSSSRGVPLMEWRILIPSSKRASKSSSKISSMTSLLKQCEEMVDPRLGELCYLLPFRE
nr:hypothetical protein [Tanacetum cinerariifolium]